MEELRKKSVQPLISQQMQVAREQTETNKNSYVEHECKELDNVECNDIRALSSIPTMKSQPHYRTFCKQQGQGHPSGHVPTVTIMIHNSLISQKEI